MPKIDEMYAFCAEESPGDEGIIGMYSQGSWVPLVGADMARVVSLNEVAIEIGKETGTTITLKKFKLVSEDTIYDNARR